MTKDNVISIEDVGGQDRTVLHNVMRMVPNKDRNDLALKRLIAFRLRIDGEGATRNYLIRQMRNMTQCAYTGRLYDFLKNDEQSRNCQSTDNIPEPPESA